MPSSVPRLAFVVVLLIHAAQAQGPVALSGSDLSIRVERLGVLGSVLYVGAHPDDENTAFIAAMANGRHVRTGYLSLTRGEGGQNLIGPEQGALLGMIRTRELLAARAIDGGEQYFTRAIDFGYSKTREETLALWGHDGILSDVVRVVRRFRPDIIVTRFTPEQGTHGNHTASALLANEAFRAAGDPGSFPEQLGSTPAWSPKRILWNGFRFQGTDATPAPPNSVTVDLGAYDPALGRSYTELAGEARTMHKSQGFGAAQNRGEFTNYFQFVDGDPPRGDLFDGVDMTWRRLRGGERVSILVDSLRASFNERTPAASIPLLFAILRAIDTTPSDPWLDVKRREVKELILGCAGLWVDVLSDLETLVAGDSLSITLTVVNRSPVPFALLSWEVTRADVQRGPAIPLRMNQPLRQTVRTIVPTDLSVTQPYWLVVPPTQTNYAVNDPSLAGLAEGPPALSAHVVLSCTDGALELDLPVRFRSVDPVDGEMYRPLQVSPPVRLAFPDPVSLFPDARARRVQVKVEGIRMVAAGTVSLIVPDGWRVSPRDVPFRQLVRDEQVTAEFMVTPLQGATSGNASAVAVVGGTSYNLGADVATYKHIPPQTLYRVASAKLVRLDLKKRGETVAYIMGAGDEVPASLRQAGYNVVLLDDEDLRTADLRRFDAIVAGIRAYNTRKTLHAVQSRLTEYMRSGGTYVVQYVTPTRGEADGVGPYPLTIGRDRVTDERAEMRTIQPPNAVLTGPNVIVPADFEGWIQERGLSYASSWSKEYIPVIASNDPGEPSHDGGLLVARVGRGHFIYTGFAFFRQLPAGVPGAYRLFANLLSLGASK